MFNQMMMWSDLELRCKVAIFHDFHPKEMSNPITRFIGSSLEHKHFQDLSQLQAAGSFFDFKVLTQLVKMGGSVPRVV